MRKTIISLLTAVCCAWCCGTVAQNGLREDFINPKDEQRALLIWQWMDGLVTKEAITKDLEAVKAAGLAGVQNFQIGGDRQSRVGDPTCAIGSEKW